mmetsp:Transcript_63122/g.147023  ORF Transcript_63122/g.147023 Transcript_63122/m.147023 type:complete len:277 (+) Transcript_63122:166-996(+)
MLLAELAQTRLLHVRDLGTLGEDLLRLAGGCRGSTAARLKLILGQQVCLFPFHLGGAVVEHKEGLDERQEPVQQRLRRCRLNVRSQCGACGRRQARGALHAHGRRCHPRGEQALRGRCHDLRVVQTLKGTIKGCPERLYPRLLEEVLNPQVLPAPALGSLSKDVGKCAHRAQETRLCGRRLSSGGLASSQCCVDISDEGGQDAKQLRTNHVEVRLRSSQRHKDLRRHLEGVALTTGSVAAASLAQEVAKGKDALLREHRVHLLGDLGPSLEALLLR